MFEAIPYIGSGLALVAFIVAVSFYAYREILKTQRDNVRHAQPSDVDDVIATASEYIKVDISQLPEGQRKDIVIRQLDIKAARESRKIWALVLCAFMIAGLTALAILTSRPAGLGSPTQSSESGPVGATAEPVEDVTPSTPTLLPNEPYIEPVVETTVAAAPDDQQILASAPTEPSENLENLPEEQLALPESEPLPDPEPIGWIYLGTLNSDNTWTQPRSDSLSGQAAEDVVGKSLVLNQTVNVRDGPYLSTYKSNGGCSNTPSNQIGRALAAASTVKIIQVQRVLPCWPEFVWAQVAVE
ncbi:hypothetical protein [Rhizobium leguminosarum]|uniref:hypothetical protein n=1 Tax=Rhizobium leguminosarum TaxID=384 RepID=UPI0014422259|nr:hypothetical protein [Rhizobium leguminosarum]MBY5820421.1 hypothetical protein [Rhizobium leguminosarum]NKL01434.1 hypothetical protein [Rhizobium leguminosarum bv. viciae]NKL78869.1 hypothetical protein [Rhizobium leguminosarum bv. viciae]